MKVFITPDETSMIAVGNGPNTDDKPIIMGIVVFGCRPGNKPATGPNNTPKDSASSIISIIRKEALFG